MLWFSLSYFQLYFLFPFGENFSSISIPGSYNFYLHKYPNTWGYWSTCSSSLSFIGNWSCVYKFLFPWIPSLLRFPSDCKTWRFFKAWFSLQYRNILLSFCQKQWDQIRDTCLQVWNCQFWGYGLWLVSSIQVFMFLSLILVRTNL